MIIFSAWDMVMNVTGWVLSFGIGFFLGISLTAKMIYHIRRRHD